MKHMKHYQILRKEECMINLEQLIHKDLVEQEDHLEVKMDIIHIHHLDLMDSMIFSACDNTAPCANPVVKV